MSRLIEPACRESELFVCEYLFGEADDHHEPEPQSIISTESSSKEDPAMKTPERSGGRRGKASVVLRMLSDRSGSWGGGCGSSVWAAAPVLCKWLLRNDRQCTHRALCSVKGKAILELGAGIGMVGMVCAQSGAREVLLTDLPRQLPLLRRNITENFGHRLRNVECSALLWGAEAPLPRPDPSGGRVGWDLIVCSDLVYDADMVPLLADTLARLLAHRGAKALCAFPDRTDFGRRQRPAATKDAAVVARQTDCNVDRRQRPWVEYGIAGGGLMPDFDLLFELLSERARQHATHARVELVVAQVAWFSAEEAGTLGSTVHLFVLELRPAVQQFPDGSGQILASVPATAVAAADSSGVRAAAEAGQGWGG
jgi:predicted nicotinamide N-methyase